MDEALTNSEPSPRHACLAARFGPRWLEPALLYLLPCLGAGLCLRLSLFMPPEPVRLVAGAALTQLTFLIAFHRLNPRLVGLLLIVLILATYYVLPIYAVLWMAANALGGLTGALLLNVHWRESDHLIWPPLATLLAFFVLVWLGDGFDLTPMRIRGERWARSELAQLRREEAALRQAFPRLAILERETPDWERAHQALALQMLVIFSMVGWAASRLARRICGPAARHPREKLIFFQLREAQIFLLIGALLLAILGSLTGLASPFVWALPLFALVGLGGLMAGLAVMLYHAILLRAMGRNASCWLLLALLAGGLILSGPFILLGLITAGLLDTWLDLRRLRLLAPQLGL